MTESATIGFRRRHLPHWTVVDRSYFVTFRLKGSLPPGVLDDLRREKEELLAKGPSEEVLNDFERTRFAKIEALLDAAGVGPKFMEVASVAKVVADAFIWLDEKKGWLVHAVTIMPNHVHALLRNERGDNHRLNEHLGVLKGYTAREANRLLDRAGSFWMDENFDHWCRSEQERQGYVEYIRQNAVKAGLVSRPENWPWTRVKQM